MKKLSLFTINLIISIVTQAQCGSINLIVNGDFEEGWLGEFHDKKNESFNFYVAGRYAGSHIENVYYGMANQYAITSKTQIKHGGIDTPYGPGYVRNFIDASPDGNGFASVIDFYGVIDNPTIYSRELEIQPEKTYRFSFEISPWSNRVGNLISVYVQENSSEIMTSVSEFNMSGSSSIQFQNVIGEFTTSADAQYIKLSIKTELSGQISSDNFALDNVSLIEVCDDDVLTSNNSNNNTDLDFFPNPAVDQLFINNSDDILNIKIFNLEGVLIRETTQTEAIDINSLSNSIYTIQAEYTNGVIKTDKFLKQ
jgi:hypothetical protein